MPPFINRDAEDVASNVFRIQEESADPLPYCFSGRNREGNGAGGQVAYRLFLHC
jgi:hypothetical protein